MLPGNQSGLNQDTHKTLNPHTRARIHSGGSGTISCIAARCIRGGAVSYKGAMGPGTLPVSRTRLKFACVSQWICLSYPMGLLLPSVLCAVRICYVLPPDVHTVSRLFSWGFFAC